LLIAGITLSSFIMKWTCWCSIKR